MFMKRSTGFETKGEASPVMPAILKNVIFFNEYTKIVSGKISVLHFHLQLN
jgi:hypothetical protein